MNTNKNLQVEVEQIVKLTDMLLERKCVSLDVKCVDCGSTDCTETDLSGDDFCSECYENYIEGMKSNGFGCVGCGTLDCDYIIQNKHYCKNCPLEQDVYETKKAELIEKITKLKEQINKPCCKSDGDVRGMCFTCVGDMTEMTDEDIESLIKCPQLYSALAYWAYNNHEVTNMIRYYELRDDNEYFDKICTLAGDSYEVECEFMSALYKIMGDD